MNPWTWTLALMLVFAIAPFVQAGSDSDQYATAGGAVYEPVGGTTAFACANKGEDPRTPQVCDVDGDGARDLPFGLGAVELRNPSGPVQNVIISSNDDVWGSNAAMIACVYHPDSDWTHCGPPDDIHSGVNCGPAALLGWPYASDMALVGVYAVFVAEDLNVCGATTGTATADFF